MLVSSIKMRNNSLSLLLILLTAPAFAQNEKVKDDGWSDLLPAGDGRQSVLDSCASCHNLKVVVDGRKSRADWAKAINDMIQRGAQLFPEEIDPITTYLSKFYGTDVPKLVNVNTATREELEKLPDLKPEIATRILDARGKAGPFKSPDELRRALGIEKAEFGKFFYLLKYRN